MSSVLEDKEAQWGDHVRRFNVTMEEPPEVYQISCVSWWGDITWRACILKSVSSMEKGFYSAAIDFGYNSSLGHFQQNLCIFRMRVICICHNYWSNHFQGKRAFCECFSLISSTSRVQSRSLEQKHSTGALCWLQSPFRSGYALWLPGPWQLPSAQTFGNREEGLSLCHCTCGNRRTCRV